MMEEYRAIKGYEGLYEVSNLGNVKSLARKDTIGRKVNEKIRKPCINSAGYLTLFLCKDRNKKSYQVHQLVAMAFLGHVPNGNKGLVTDHKDNNPLNNTVENLQLITHRENTSKDIKGFSSDYTGVSWDKSRSKWRVTIIINGKQKYLGRFTDETEAHKAYQAKLKEIL